MRDVFGCSHLIFLRVHVRLHPVVLLQFRLRRIFNAVFNAIVWCCRRYQEQMKRTGRLTCQHNVRKRGIHKGTCRCLFKAPAIQHIGLKTIFESFLCTMEKDDTRFTMCPKSCPTKRTSVFWIVRQWPVGGLHVLKH